MSKKSLNTKDQLLLNDMFSQCEKRNEEAKKNASIKQEVEESTTNEPESSVQV